MLSYDKIKKMFNVKGFWNFGFEGWLRVFTSSHVYMTILHVAIFNSDCIVTSVLDIWLYI